MTAPIVFPNDRTRIPAPYLENIWPPGADPSALIPETRKEFCEHKTLRPDTEGTLWRRLADFDVDERNNHYTRSIVSLPLYDFRIARAFLLTLNHSHHRKERAA